MDKTKDYFNQIAEDYDSSADGKFVKRMYGEVVRQIMEVRPGTLLDLGCGNGNVLLAVGRQYPASLYGLDISEKMIAEAGKRLGELTAEGGGSAAAMQGKGGGPAAVMQVKAGSPAAAMQESAGSSIAFRQETAGARCIDLRVGDAAALPYENGFFDTVICNASFHHYLNPGQVLGEIRRVLKPGGTLVLGDPTAPFFLRPLLNTTFSARSSGDHHLYGKQEMIRLLKGAGFSVKKWKVIKLQAFVLTAERI